MVTPRPSDSPPDRLARLLQETAGDAAGADDGTPPVDDGEASGGWDLVELAGDVLPGGRHRHQRVPLLSVPMSLRSAQLAVGSRAVRGLLVLAVVVTLVVAGRWLWAQRPVEAAGVDRVAELGVEHAEGAAQTTGPGGRDESAGAGDTAEQAVLADAADGQEVGARTGGEPAPDLVVHVTGQVEEPGVVELPAGSRVVDAVRAVGGLTDEADQSSVNLARLLTDGEQLWVGRPGEPPPAGVAPPPAPGRQSGGAGSGGASQDATGPVPLDLNAATQADLEGLPGIGPVTAGHILAWRDEHGRFSRVDELLEVSGIGEKTLAQLEPHVRVGG